MHSDTNLKRKKEKKKGRKGKPLILVVLTMNKCDSNKNKIKCILYHISYRELKTTQFHRTTWT